jgi:hypothetical protein
MRIACFAFAMFSVIAPAQRINHAGRILPDLPTVTSPLLFNTAAADRVMAALQLMPRTNPWNEDVSRRPLLANSAAMIAQIKSELASNRQGLWGFYEMNYGLVPTGQPLVPVPFVDYPDESDPSPYPIPANQPIETWPISTDGQTLDQWQRDVNNWGGDRHSITLQPSTGLFWETWQMKKTNSGWQASNGAKFNLNSNALRPLGWTSGDAAGFPMLPALVRFDEVQRGTIEHALRLVVKHTRVGPIYPARHSASRPQTSDPKVPAMGQRLRLKKSFAIPSGWTREEKAVLVALKKYGGMVSDNGNFFSFSITPDDRWAAGCFNNLKSVDLNNFEVIQTTGVSEGPRSANPPLAKAGPDKTTKVGQPLALAGSATGGSAALSVYWYKYSGPGVTTFSTTSKAATSVTFSAVGTYTLMLRAEDGIHTPAYDAVVVKVTS